MHPWMGHGRRSIKLGSCIRLRAVGQAGEVEVKFRIHPRMPQTVEVVEYPSAVTIKAKFVAALLIGLIIILVLRATP